MSMETTSKYVSTQISFVAIDIFYQLIFLPSIMETNYMLSCSIHDNDIVTAFHIHRVDYLNHQCGKMCMYSIFITDDIQIKEQNQSIDTGLISIQTYLEAISKFLSYRNHSRTNSFRSNFAIVVISKVSDINMKSVLVLQTSHTIEGRMFVDVGNTRSSFVNVFMHTDKHSCRSNGITAYVESCE